MQLDLTDEETVESARYPFSPRIRTLRAILAKLRAEPVREPPPPPKVHALPYFFRGRRRHGRKLELGSYPSN
jgi:hypothetical protein